MPVPIEPRPSAAGTSRRGLLVLGYQGTLEPDLAAGTEPFVQIRELPFESWVAAAVRDLQRRPLAGPCACEGKCFAPGTLVDSLRDRLTGILTQILALNPDATEETRTNQFPALPALLQTAAAEWVNAIAVFHERFHRDASRLAAWLGLAKLPELASLSAATSDAHSGGHGVLQLTFRDGRCLYYKPRPVTGEWLWDGLVRSVNAHSSLQLTSAAALPGSNGRYGWVVSLPPREELHASESDAWWHAAGATLCLAAHVRMADLHLANILATRNGPAPVDAESLGTPPSTATTRTQREPITAILDNLLDTGLLPVPDPGGLPDVSGLFGKSAVVPQLQVPRWSAAPGGERRLQFVPAVLLDHGNAPSIVSPLQVLPHLVSGYREAADALMRCRESLLAPQSPWRSALECLHAPRIILRDTLSYGLLLSQSLAPEHLQSAQRRRIAVRNALRLGSGPEIPDAVLRTELRDLLHLHIPRFTALPGSRTLASHAGGPLAQRFLSCSPAEAVLAGMQQLSVQSLREFHIPVLQLALLQQLANS